MAYESEEEGRETTIRLRRDTRVDLGGFEDTEPGVSFGMYVFDWELRGMLFGDTCKGRFGGRCMRQNASVATAYLLPDWERNCVQVIQGMRDS